MDPHHHHHHQIAPDDPLPAPQYYYASEQEQQYAAMGYPHPQMPPYQVQVQHPGQQQTRQLDLQQQHPIQQQYHPNITLISSHQYQQSPRPLPASPPPPSPDMYDPLSPPLSGSDTSADGIYQGSNSSGANSPASSRANSLVQRHIRYNPTPSPTSSSGHTRRRRGRSQDSDDDDMNLMYTENLAQNRKEATRRQRIEAEQRRRDELRDGYAKLKDVLPVSNQKSSKVSLLDRATSHIVVLESENKALLDRITGLEDEIRRLQAINEKLSGGSLETPSPGMYERPLSPPPEVTTLQSQHMHGHGGGLAPLPLSQSHSHSSLAGATGPPPLQPDPDDSVSTPSDGGF
ncbi:Transcription factor [Mycena venus]|uniref:Transcription factor n=1 Tax=Mycena venus TaxID=2733690 RepID=A0A8H6XVZ7_9AGAR|nr:Transcription factor [Mycena venus]